MFVQQRLSRHRSQALVLQIIAPGVRRTAQQKRALAVVFQIRLHRVKAHEGRERDRVGAIALKGFDGILLGGGANVAALGIQNNRHMRRIAAHVCHELFQLLFSAVRSEVSNLGLERNGQIGCGIDNLRAKIIDLAGIALHACRKFAGFRVKADAQQ